MLGKKLVLRKKSLILMFFGVAFLILGFGAAPQPAQACKITCRDVYLGPSVLNCDHASAFVLGADSACVVSSARMQDLCSPACWASTADLNPCLNTGGDSKEACQEGACPGNATLVAGTPCSVFVPGSLPTCPSVTQGSGKYTGAPRKQCVECVGANNKGKVWGDTLGVYAAPPTVFKEYCGADASCDGRVAGYLCAGSSNCDANGKCVATGALVLGASPSPIQIEKGGTSTVTFKVTAAGVAKSGATVTSITTSGVPGSSLSASTCITGGTGECTVVFTAGSSTGTAAVTSPKATLAGFTASGSATALIKVTNKLCSSTDCSSAVASACDCNTDNAPAGSFCCDTATGGTFAFGSKAACQGACPSCSAAEITEINGGGSGNCNAADAPCEKIGGLSPGVSLRMQNTSRQVDLFDPNGLWGGNWAAGTSMSGNRGNDVATCVPGTWNIKLHGKTCSASAVSGGTCPVCNSAADCNGDQKCVGGQWANCGPGETCSAGACVPTGPPPSISSPFCEAALIGSDNGTKCGNSYTVKPGDIGIGWCCSAVDMGGGDTGFVYGSKIDCQHADPLCAGASACTINNILEPGEQCDTSQFGGKTCVSLGFGGGTLACDASCNFVTTGCVPIPPPPPPCSGPGMFVSPLGSGYCTIGEILTKATNWILSLVASIIILILVIGGLMYISSTGDEEKLRASKNVIFYAIVGLGIILISYALITEVTNILKGP